MKYLASSLLLILFITSSAEAQVYCQNGQCYAVPAPITPPAQPVIPIRVRPLDLQGYIFRTERIGLFGWRTRQVPIPIWQMPRTPQAPAEQQKW